MTDTCHFVRELCQHRALHYERRRKCSSILEQFSSIYSEIKAFKIINENAKNTNSMTSDYKQVAQANGKDMKNL